MHVQSANEINSQQLLGEMRKGATVRVYDLSKLSRSEFGPSAVVDMDPVPAGARHVLSLRLPKSLWPVHAESATGGVKFEMEPSMHAINLLVTGAHDRTAILRDAQNRKVLELRIPTGAKPQPKSIDLGEINPPGARLGGQTFTLKPGQELKFKTRMNQIQGISAITAEPPGSLSITEKAGPRPDALGGQTEFSYTLRVPEDARPGRVRVTSQGVWQSRSNPDWSFSFGVNVV